MGVSRGRGPAGRHGGATRPWAFFLTTRRQQLCVCRHSAPPSVLPTLAHVQDRLEDLLLLLAPEGRHAAEQDVEDDAAGPDVGLGAVALAQNLRRHVIGCGGAWGTFPRGCQVGQREGARERRAQRTDASKRHPPPLTHQHTAAPCPSCSSRQTIPCPCPLVLSTPRLTRAHHLLELLPGLEVDRQPKVGALDVGVGGLARHQKVLGLQVPAGGGAQAAEARGRGVRGGYVGVCRGCGGRSGWVQCGGRAATDRTAPAGAATPQRAPAAVSTPPRPPPPCCSSTSSISTSTTTSTCV